MVGRAILYAVCVFIALGVISLLVSGIMMLMYSIVHKGEKKPKIENNAAVKV